MKKGDLIFLDPRCNGASLYRETDFWESEMRYIDANEPMFVLGGKKGQYNTHFLRVITKHGVGYVIRDIINREET